MVVNAQEAQKVRHIYARYLALGCVRRLKAEFDAQGYVSKRRLTANRPAGGKPFSRGALYTLLKNPVYRGKIAHRSALYDGPYSTETSY